jgi:hypothetical protein
VEEKYKDPKKNLIVRDTGLARRKKSDLNVEQNYRIYETKI